MSPASSARTVGPVDQAAAILGDIARRDVPLGERTTYKVGGAAALWVEPVAREDLLRISQAVAQSGVEVLVLGAGSNLLVADAGWPGLVVHLSDSFAGLETATGEIVAGGALALPRMARRCAASGVTGIEWAVGIPGSVGGAVRMNAGGHGSDMAARIRRAEVWDVGAGECRWWSPERLQLGYRKSAVHSDQIVLAAVLEAGEGNPQDSQARIDEIVRWRREHQPGSRNAGSVFVNPPGDSAGRLVEAAGCKGLRLASAVVSDKHANFILADPGGSADDVAALVAIVRKKVAEESGITLSIEMRMVGFANHNSQVEV
jgi:UDP-N-acetylmuramate dehydrogenase